MTSLALTLENTMKEKQSWESYMYIYLLCKKHIPFYFLENLSAQNIMINIYYFPKHREELCWEI